VTNITGLLALGRILLDSGVVNGGVTPVSGAIGTGWEILTMEGVRDVNYGIDIDPDSLEAYRQREAQLKALRG